MLKKLSILLILSLVSQLSFAAVDNSIAVINLEKVKNDTKAGQSISQQFNDLQEKFKDKVSKLSQDFDKKKQELDKQKSILSKEAFAKKESEFQAKLADLRKDLQAEANKVEQMNQNALAEFQGIARKVIEELVKEEAPITNELKFEFTPNTITETEPTLDDLEKLMQAQELAEEQAKLNDELEAFEVQTTLPLEPVKPLVAEVTPVAEVSLLDKLSAAMRTPDVVEKIAREQQQSLKQAINLNKKIAFVNNLFNENTVEYAKAIEKLNASSTLHEALRYFNELKHQYSWSNENALVKELEQLIEKRYS